MSILTRRYFSQSATKLSAIKSFHSLSHYVKPFLLKGLVAVSLTITIPQAYASFGCQLNKGYQLPENVELMWLCSFNNEMAPAHHIVTNKYGAVNRQGEVVIPLEYDSPVEFQFGKAMVKKGTQWILLNSNNQQLATFDFQEATNFTSRGISLFKQNDKWGVVNIEGDIILKPQFDNIIYNFRYTPALEHQNIAIFEQAGKQGALNVEGKIILPAQFDSVIHENDILLVFNNDKMGIYDLEGRMQQPVEFEPSAGFYIDNRWTEENWMPVVKDGKMGAVDKYGKTIVPFEFDEVDIIGENIFKVSKDRKYGIYGLSGPVTPLHYDLISDSIEHPTLVKYQGKWGYLDSFNSLMLVDYDLAGEFSEGLAMVGNYNNLAQNATNHDNIQSKVAWGYINSIGEEVIPLDYASVRDFKDGLVAVNYNGKWGVIDFDRNQIAPFEYDAISSYKNGYAIVGNYISGCEDAIKNSHQMIRNTDVRDKNINGHTESQDWDDEGLASAEAEDDEINADIYDDTKCDAVAVNDTSIDSMIYREDLPMVFGMINQQGRLLLQVKFQNISRAAEGMIAVKHNDKWGFANQQGDLVFPYQFDQIFPPFEGGTMQVDKCQDESGETIYCQADEVHIESLTIDKQGNIINRLSSIVSYETDEMRANE